MQKIFLTISVVKTEFAQSILDSHIRCETSYLNLEKALDELRELECDTWQSRDDELDDLLDKLNKDSISCEKQFITSPGGQ